MDKLKELKKEIKEEEWEELENQHTCEICGKIKPLYRHKGAWVCGECV